MTSPGSPQWKLLNGLMTQIKRDNMRIFIDVRLQATQLTYSNHADFAQLAKVCC